MPTDFQSLLRPLVRPGDRHSIAISQGDRNITAGLLSNRIAARPAWADDMSGRPTIMVTGLTGPDWLISVLNGLYHGADVALMDDHLPGDDRRAMVDVLQPDAVITANGEYDLSLSCPVYSFEPTKDHQPSKPEFRDTDQRLIFHTSGTTGVPKWVPLTCENITHQVKSLDQTGLLPTSAGVANPLPLFHVYPFVIGCFYPLIRQGKVILPINRNAAGILHLIRRDDSQILIGVPQLYNKLIHGFLNRLSGIKGTLINGMMTLAGKSNRMARIIGHIARKMGVINLDLVASGGAALPHDIHRQLMALGMDLATGYGLTETSPLVAWNLPDKSRPGSAGTALPSVEIKISEAGEILVRGPNIFNGYLAETRKKPFNDDGYFKTGDRGKLDADGYLWVTGRMDRCITLPSGKNIDPVRVEEKVEELSSIEMAGLILSGDGKLILYIQPVEAADHHHIRSHVKQLVQDLPAHCRPSKIVVMDNLPTTTLGKLRRHRLSEDREGGG